MHAPETVRTRFPAIIEAIISSPSTDPVGAITESAGAATDLAGAATAPVLTNVADALTRQAARMPDAVAVDVDGRVLSFRRLETLVWRSAAHFVASGVRPGDVVAMAFARPLTHLVCMLAVARLGGTVLSIPSAAPPRQVLELLDAAAATVLIGDTVPVPSVDDPSASDGSGALSSCRSLRLRLGMDLASIAASSQPVTSDVRDPAPQAPWLIITGSGSTGRSKLIPVTHAQYLARMDLLRPYYLPARDRVLSLVGLDFASAKNLCLEVLFAGGAIVLVEQDRSDLASLCRARRVSVVWASVVHLEQLLAACREGAGEKPDGAGVFDEDAGVFDEDAGVLPGVRILFVGSSTVSDALRRKVLRHVSPNLHVRYGTNESGVISIATPDMIRSTPGTVGRPVDGVRVELVDTHGGLVGDGEAGLVRVHSAAVFDGYPDDAEATRRVFDAHGLLCGDVARRTPDGQLIHCGRSDQMMIMDGINIHPAEIERALGEHPSVADAVAMPLHSDVHQDIPICAVALHPGARATEDDLRRFATERLGVRAPRRVLVLAVIPRNPQGKVVRAQLVQAVEALLHTGAHARS